jgi:putative addiction module component (TIGR02574 family)
MSATELNELRDVVKKYIDIADENVLKKVNSIFEEDIEYEKSGYTLTPDQEVELDRRMKLEEDGLMKYSSWEDVEMRIRTRKKM